MDSNGKDRKIITILAGPETWDNWIFMLRNRLDPETWDAIKPVNPIGDIATEPEPPKASEVVPNATSVAEFTSAQINVYDFLYRDFERRDRKYTEQKAEMRRASEYIITSIEEKFLTLLHDLVGPRAMLKRLYEAASPTPGFMAREITPKYNEALKGPRDLRALPQWLDRWETVIMKAFRYRLPATFNGQWLREMGKAIEPLTSFHGQALMQAACRLDEVAAQITIQGASYLLPEGSITVIRPGDAPAAPSNAISLLDDASIYTYRKALNNVRDWV
ncbi:hypothetical protein ACO1O0_003035 [Amphichorda felina]